MIRQDWRCIGTNASTSARAFALLLRWPVLKAGHRDIDAAIRPLVARQDDTNVRLLAYATAGPPPARPVPWLVCQSLLGAAVLTFTSLMWAFALALLTLPAWWRLVPEEPVPGLSVVIRSETNALFIALIGLPVGVIAVASSHGLPRWHADVDRWLRSGPQRNRLNKRIAVLTESRTGALEVQAAELRRIERDLHDGAQARLVSVNMLLGLLDLKLPDESAGTREILTSARDQVGIALHEMRALIRNVYPPILADRGLTGGIESLAEHAGAGQCSVTVAVEVAERLPVALESAVYFVVAEALTNVVKHSGAKKAEITVHSDQRRVRVEVRDDGRGGADERHGTGLAGLRRRAAAFDGELSLLSPVGGPTVLHVELPCVS